LGLSTNALAFVGVNFGGELYTLSGNSILKVAQGS
jgi:hypothetical protein